MALDGIGSLIENELKLLIEKCLADYAEKEQEKNENSPWFTSYVRNAPKTNQKTALKCPKILWKLALRRKTPFLTKNTTKNNLRIYFYRIVQQHLLFSMASCLASSIASVIFL